ncbi:DUF4824 family protein [Pseudomonas sp. CAU 1711]|uniref:DUF4824 family protein n=1 Tax=Pseudomonas sp. CAU 1711 TaxID=3140356 RepID=UPI003260BC5E
MIALKPRHGLLAGLALILLSNAVALGGAWYNRQGEAESRLLLSERELWRSHDGMRRENSGLSLHLDWRTPRDPESESRYSRQSLGEATLLRLGFEPHAGSAQRWRQPRERQALIVLELDGPAYRAELLAAEQELLQAERMLALSPDSSELKEKAELARKALEHERTRASRLFAIDAGSDIQTLRQRYPDRSRYAIVGGTVRAWCSCGGDDPHRLQGQVDALLVDELNVPATWRAQLAERMPRRYESEQLPLQIEVSFGRRLEPWIGALRLAEKAGDRDDGGATAR